MKLIRDLDNLPDSFRRGAVAIGNFDGVHRGHARIVERLLATARQIGGAAVVFTFDPHPAVILRPQQVPPPLCSTAHRIQLLADLGADAVIAYPTDESFLQLDARAFFDQILLGQLGVRALVEGVSFSFGRSRGGNVEALQQFCRESDVLLEVVEPVRIDGQVVSSSRIRNLLVEGRVEQARRMLARPYRIRGLVIHGAGRGRQLGYPTANLDEVETLLPSGGIYAGRASADGRWWPAAISIGPNPTFGEGAWKVEAHLIDYEGWLYNRHVEIDFLARLRDIQRFDSASDLVRQMDRDIAATREIAA